MEKIEAQNISFEKAKEELDTYRLKLSEARVLAEEITKLEREISSAGGSVIPMPDGSVVNNLSTKIAYLTDLKDSLNKKLHEAEYSLLLIDSRISKMEKEYTHFLTLKYICRVPSSVIAHHDGYSVSHVKRKLHEAVENYATLYFS